MITTTSPTTTTPTTPHLAPPSLPPFPPPAPPPFLHPPPALLAQGAEALLYSTTFLTPSTRAILKYRPSKPYRHPLLDKRLTRHRILSEARALVKCRREGVGVPGVLGVDVDGGGGGGWMVMELIEGGTVKEGLGRWGRGRERKRGEVMGLMGRIGAAVGRMHEVGVVHGDLTTSNLMVRPRRVEGVEGRGRVGSGRVVGGGGCGGGLGEGEDDGVGRDGEEDVLEGEIVLIDFGLAGQSVQDEDRAVDLYVLERAFGSTHPELEDGFREVLRAYGESYRGAGVVLKRLEEVRMRGRKRSMLG